MTREELSIKALKVRNVLAGALVASPVLFPVVAFASDPSTPAATPGEQIVGALKDGFTDAVTTMISGIVEIIPVALPVLAGFLTIAIGIKAFKKITGR